MSERIARKYHEDKNPDGAHLPGVPLRDITVSEWEAYPDWLRASIDIWNAYSAPKGAPEKQAPAEPDKE